MTTRTDIFPVHPPPIQRGNGCPRSRRDPGRRSGPRRRLSAGRHGRRRQDDPVEPDRFSSCKPGREGAVHDLDRRIARQAAGASQRSEFLRRERGRAADAVRVRLSRADAGRSRWLPQADCVEHLRLPAEPDDHRRLSQRARIQRNRVVAVEVHPRTECAGRGHGLHDLAARAALGQRTASGAHAGRRPDRTEPLQRRHAPRARNRSPQDARAQSSDGQAFLPHRRKRAADVPASGSAMRGAAGSGGSEDAPRLRLAASGQPARRRLRARLHDHADRAVGCRQDHALSAVSRGRRRARRTLPVPWLLRRAATADRQSRGRVDRA